MRKAKREKKEKKIDITTPLCDDVLDFIFGILYVYELMRIRKVCKYWNKIIKGLLERKIKNKKKLFQDLFLGSDYHTFIRNTFKFDINEKNFFQLVHIIAIKDFSCDICWDFEKDRLLSSCFRPRQKEMHCCGFKFKYCCDYSRYDILTKYCGNKYCELCSSVICRSCDSFTCCTCTRQVCKHTVIKCQQCDKYCCHKCLFKCVMCVQKCKQKCGEKCKKKCKVYLSYCTECVKNNFINDCVRCHKIWFDEYTLEELELVCKKNVFRKYESVFYRE